MINSDRESRISLRANVPAGSVVDISSLDPFLPLMVVLDEGLKETSVEEGGVNDSSTNDVRIHVRCRASVLNVSLLLSSSGGWDAN